MPQNQYSRDASARLTFELSQLRADSYREICADVVAAFQLVPDNELVSNGDVMFQDWRQGSQTVELRWDNWTGFSVTATTASSEPLVGAIGAWLLESKWAVHG